MALIREDLKDFQARVQERLRIAREQGPSASWLAVTVRAMNCLFPLSQANEVMPYVSQVKVPYTKPWFIGAVSARGRIYGAVDLYAFLHQGTELDSGALQAENAIAQLSLVGLNPDLNLNCLLLVHKVLGLRTNENFEKSVAPHIGAPAYLGMQYHDSTGTMWQEINLHRLSRDPTFVSISV